MMDLQDDRQLLELAAKAAGFNIVSHTAHAAFIGSGIGGKAWNPLTDDGDEAHLEATLSLLVSWDEIGVTVGGTVTSDGDIFGGEFEPYHKHACKQDARRCAGVRAAAAIGSKL